MARFALMGAMLASSALGIAMTPAERSKGRLMRAPDHSGGWPAWFYGPNGASEVFAAPGDVPAGWQDHPSKVITPERTGSKPAPAVVDKVPGEQTGTKPAKVENNASAEQTGGKPADAGDVSNTLDSDGWPFDIKLHAATMTKTKDGKWRMKVGVSRPDPKPGFPKPVLDL